jgi:hypothetical protein
LVQHYFLAYFTTHAEELRMNHRHRKETPPGLILGHELTNTMTMAGNAVKGTSRRAGDLPARSQVHGQSLHPSRECMDYSYFFVVKLGTNIGGYCEHFCCCKD